MMNTEKVISDLEQCLDDSVAAVVPADTVRDAIELLKAQEPCGNAVSKVARVMTKDELDGYISSFDGEARVWIEHRKLGLYCASLWSSNPSMGDDNFYDVVYELYYERLEIGHWWRPWTSRPDEKTREETPWN